METFEESGDESENDQIKWNEISTKEREIRTIEKDKIIIKNKKKYYYLNKIDCKIDELIWVLWKSGSVK